MRQRQFHLFTSILFFLVGVGTFLVPRNWLPGTISHPAFYGFLLVISAVLVYAPPFIIKNKQTERKQRLVRNMQSAIAFSLILNNAGEFGLYKLYQDGFQYDKFCHFLVPMLLAFLLAESLRAWEHLSFKKIAWITMAIVMASGIAWELFEYGSDLFFHTQEWGVYGHDVIADTAGDVFCDILGGVAGIVVYRIPSKYKVRKNRLAQP